MPKIFISYRRGDSIDATGRIDDRLAAHFGRDEVFRDVDTISPGSEFSAAIAAALHSCQVLLAIIGEAWLDARTEDGQVRLEFPHDYVRREIETALQTDKVVIPVLVRWGTLPAAQRLPESLRPLVSRNAAEVRSDRDFHSHVDRLIRDLEQYVGLAKMPTSHADVVEIPVVPKGLRSFDTEDADYFLQLLPGPRDSHGLPESIRFWKSRIEETESTNTFRAGLMYGPSGCGKSSLVKAGLLPHLADHVKPIFVDASAEHTEAKLLQQLRRSFPQTKPASNLEETVDLLLRDDTILPSHQKVVLVIDQFEQWIQTHPELIGQDLLRAVARCDGEKLQCLILVRDDFYVGVSRFFAALDIDLSSSRNQALVDRFDLKHAQQVLTAFGRAYGRLPKAPEPLSSDQQQFVQRAIEELSQEQRIICVRLALFTEMVKDTTWHPDTFDQLGGVAGIGIKFLEQQLESRWGNPLLLQHRQTVRAVLRCLLPDPGSNVRGHHVSLDDLHKASGIVQTSDVLKQVLDVLDRDLRLITSTEPELTERAEHREESNAGGVQRFFQLTHDYLIPPLRQWLARKQQETRRGRAELRLAERAALWHDKPEDRHLPSLWEYVKIRLLTDSDRWDLTQQKMLRRAARVHTVRLTTTLVMALLITFGMRTMLEKVASMASDYGTTAAGSNRFAATIAAQSLESELAAHADLARREAVTTELTGQIQQTLSNQAVRQSLEAIALLQTPAATFDNATVREPFRAIPVRRQLDELLLQRLRVCNQSSVSHFASILAIDASGTIIGSASTRPVDSTHELAGLNVCFRSYFHGRATDLPRDTLITDVLPVNHTRFSRVFMSTATGRFQIAVSTPVYLDQDRSRPAALLVTSIDLSDLPTLKRFTSEDALAVLVQAMEGPDHGLILHHPLFATQESVNFARANSTAFRLSGNMMDRLSDGVEVNYHDPLAQAPGGEAFAGPWIAVSHPVLIRQTTGEGKSSEWVKAGFLVLIQYRLELSAAKQIWHALLWFGAAAIVSLLLMKLILVAFERRS